jgi:hypothetical protein
VQLPDWAPREFAELLTDMLRVHPQERPDIAEVGGLMVRVHACVHWGEGGDVSERGGRRARRAAASGGG